MYELLARVANDVVGSGIIGTLNILEHSSFFPTVMYPPAGPDPYRSFRFREVPHLLMYRYKEPVGHYNGEMTVQSLANYLTVLAKDPSYYEPLEITAGTTVDINMELPGKKPYLNTSEFPNLVAKNSFELKEDIRGYDTNIGLVQKGTSSEEQGLKKLQQDVSGSVPPQGSSSSSSSSSTSPGSVSPSNAAQGSVFQGIQSSQPLQRPPQAAPVSPPSAPLTSSPQGTVPSSSIPNQTEPKRSSVAPVRPSGV